MTGSADRASYRQRLQRRGDPPRGRSFVAHYGVAGAYAGTPHRARPKAQREVLHSKEPAIHHGLPPSAAEPKTYRPSAPERVVKSRCRHGRVVTPCNFFVSATACSAHLSRSATSTSRSAARVRLFSQRSICRRACAEPLSAARRFARRFATRSALAFAFLKAVRAWLNSVRARPAGVWSNLRERARLSAIVNCLYGGSSVSVVSAVIGCVPVSKATMSRRAAALPRAGRASRGDRAER